MQAKFIYFSNQQVQKISKDASEREISFTEMVRRIIDTHYDGGSAVPDKKSDKGKKQ
jgi:hypothetical protein